MKKLNSRNSRKSALTFEIIVIILDMAVRGAYNKTADVVKKISSKPRRCLNKYILVDLGFLVHFFLDCRLMFLKEEIV